MSRILVVDDEEGVREFLAEALRDDGHTVEVAGDGAEAVERLGHDGYDLMMTDLRMPRYDGLSLVRFARAACPTMPVLVLTAYGSVDSAVEAMKLGAVDYLQKPIQSPRELRSLVRRALDRPRKASPSSNTQAHGRWVPIRSDLLQTLCRETADEYEIFEEIGVGATATVFRARDLALDREVALKVMAPDLTEGVGMVERFRREARIAASLTHPHIVPIYAVRQTPTFCFFTMKRVEGPGLGAALREAGRFDVDRAVAVTVQAGGALSYAHRHGVVHRDVKPDNVLLERNGWVVVTDFGIAKLTEQRGLTVSGAALGTPTYMSPEQCVGEPITGASDQYSLGVVLFEMLAGRPPFEVGNPMALLWAHVHTPAPDLGARRPGLPPGLVTAVSRMLAKSPTDRFSTLDLALAEIDSAVPSRLAE